MHTNMHALIIETKGGHVTLHAHLSRPYTSPHVYTNLHIYSHIRVHTNAHCGSDEKVIKLTASITQLRFILFFFVS